MCTKFFFFRAKYFRNVNLEISLTNVKGALYLSAKAGVHEKGTFTVQDTINNIKKDPNYHKAGAIGLFIGVVRGETFEGQKVEKLQLEAYEEKANQVLGKICDDLSESLE